MRAVEKVLVYLSIIPAKCAIDVEERSALLIAMEHNVWLEWIFISRTCREGNQGFSTHQPA